MYRDYVAWSYNILHFSTTLFYNYLLTKACIWPREQEIARTQKGADRSSKLLGLSQCVATAAHLVGTHEGVVPEPVGGSFRMWVILIMMKNLPKRIYILEVDGEGSSVGGE